MITLIGEDLAEVGLSFIFDGPAESCKNCRFKASCIDSLEKGRKYTITKVKDIDQKCDIHDGHIVKAVEIKLDDIDILLDSKKAFEGSNVLLDHPDCTVDCPYSYLCFPEGLFENDRCVIIKNLEKHTGVCDKEFNLTKVRLRLME